MLRRLFELVITLTSLLAVTDSAGVNWNNHDDMRTGQQVMYTSPSANSFYRVIDTPISYYIVYSSIISSTRSAGVGIVGINTVIGYDCAVNTTVQNFTIYSLRITARVYGDTTLSFFAVNWIAIGNGIDFAEILFNCHLCTSLKVGQGDRWESRTGVTLFAGYSKLFVNVYLAGFSLRNVDGITNYLKATATINNGSNIINYRFAVNQNNTVTQICYTTIIFCEICTQVDYYNWGTTGSEQLSNANDPSVLPFPADIDYQEQDRMFFGISALNMSRASRRIFYMNTTEYGSMTTDYTTNEGTYAVMMDFFWLAVRSCNNSDKYFVVYNKTCENNCNAANNTLQKTDTYLFCKNCHFTCLTCDSPLSTNCNSCEQSYFRELVGGPSGSCNCNSSYIDIGVALCYPCQNFIPGCDTCSSTFLCITCFPGFVLQPSGVCQCASGFMVSGACTNITGCTNLVQYGGTIFCTACNATLHFQPTTTYLCQCMPGYYLSSTQLCLPTCGDAKQITEQSCDDGNLVNEDGCSSSCVTQYKWICLGGTPTTPSTCYIYDPDLKMVVKYVRRVTSMNRMQVGIRFVPNYNQFSSANFKQYLSHTVPSTNYNATFIDGQLLLEVDYNQTIQGLFYSLTLKLDPNLFYNTTLNVQIPTSGMNAKLTYDYNNSINYPLEIIVIVLDVLAIIVMFASCVSERMIGIQMIQTLQTVLFAQAVMKTTPSSLSPLQMLRYASGYNQAQGIDYDRTYTFAFSLSSLGLEKQFLLSFNVMYIVLMVVIGVCCILKAKQQYHENKIGKFTHDEDEIKNQHKFAKTTKIYNFIFERILFLTVFMSMYLIVFSLMLQLSDMSGDYWLMSKEFNMLSAIIGIAILSTMTCAVILNGCFPGTLIFPMLMKQYYPPIYFIYQSTFIFLLAFDYTQEYVLYILAAMAVVFMVYNLIHQPYPEKFHTFVLVFHQLVIIGVIGIYIFENLTKPTEHETLYKILNATIIGILYIVVGLNAYRLYKYYRFLQKNGWDQYGNQIQPESGGNAEDLSYKQLKTPKPYRDTGMDNDRMFRAKNTQPAPKKKKNDDLMELQQVKKSANKEAPKSKPVQDETEMNWNYNKLADEDNQPTRFQATNRDARPDTSRDRPLTRNKTLDKNMNDNNVSFNNNNKDDDDENTVRNIDSGNKNGNNGEYDNDDEYNFDNPYDENGYAKKTAQTPRKVDEDDEDPLQAIKRKLKKDFNSKLKTSTLKQY